MQKGVKILGLLILGLVFTSMLVGVVSAEDLKSKFVETFSSIFDSNNSVNQVLAKIFSPEILFGLLVFLIIFAVVSKIPLFAEDWIKITVSIIVGILAGGFIPIEWFGPLLNQYTAVGILVTLVLPFILIFYFVKEVVPTNELAQKAIWGAYLFIVAFNAIINSDKVPTGADKTLVYWLYGILIFATVIMFLWGGKILHKLYKEEMKNAYRSSERFNELINFGKLVEAKELYDRASPYLSSERKKEWETDLAHLSKGKK